MMNGRRSFLKFLGAGAAGTAIVKAEVPQPKPVVIDQEKAALIEENRKLQDQLKELTRPYEPTQTYSQSVAFSSASILFHIPNVRIVNLSSRGVQ